MSAKVFVDTNVLVYGRDASEANKQRAAADWIRHLWVNQCGRISIQVLNEFYVTVTRKLEPGLHPNVAWDDVRALFAWRPQVITADVLERARDVEQRFGLSWRDSMIVASAQMQNCAVLLSEDLQDGLVCDGVTVRSPFRSEITDATTSYDVLPEPESRHRPRGRPRRSVTVPG